MIKDKKIFITFLAVIMVFTVLQLKVQAAEQYGYEVVANPSPVAIGNEVTLTIRLTDYTKKKSGIRGFQIDIADVDDVLHEAVCTALVSDTEDVLSNTAKYQTSRDIVRHAYVKMSGTMSYDVADLLEVKFKIPESYTEAGILSLPLKMLIQNQAGDKITYTDTIKISYAPAEEIPENPDSELSKINVTWGAMEFVYTDGTWNPQTYKYEGAGWTDNGSGYINVKNESSLTSLISFSYDTNRSDISASFTDGDSKNLDKINVESGQEANVYISLSGKPIDSLSSTTIGTVTMRIGGE